jgi:DNA polymerase-3 subunit gamma/tau
VAEVFSEEDLARHLQIMLRTYGELGYRQEQRFHLELGLLKLAHAQRLLPLEQLLSEAGTAPALSVAKSTSVTDIRRSDASAISRPSPVSPFAADSARKSSMKPQLSSESMPVSSRPATTSSMPPPVVMGAAALAEALPEEVPAQTTMGDTPTPDRLAQASGEALKSAGHRVLASMLEAGEWHIAGGEVVIKVAASASLIDMSLGTEAKRLLIATASGLLGRPAKVTVLPAASVDPTNISSTASSSSKSNGSGRDRVEQNPVVRKMKELFGAEIRTIIDYKEKR